MGIEFWIQLIITIGGIAALGGGILARLSILEKKMDKHNGIVEKVARVEESCKSAHHRLDRIDDIVDKA